MFAAEHVSEAVAPVEETPSVTRAVGSLNMPNKPLQFAHDSSVAALMHCAALLITPHMVSPEHVVLVPVYCVLQVTAVFAS